MGFAVTYPSTYEIFINMYAHTFLHMHITLLATVSTATATVTQESETEGEILNTMVYKFQLLQYQHRRLKFPNSNHTSPIGKRL
jgi:hypothetical protein